MDAHTAAVGPHAATAVGTRHATTGDNPSCAFPILLEYDVAVNAESRTFQDGDDLVSILSVHTLVCPLIRAELRGDDDVRLLIYYPASTRLGLQAYEAVLRHGDDVREQLGLRRFVRETLKRPETRMHLHDPGIREMYLHEIIRGLARPIAACRLESTAEFAVARLI